MSKIERKQYLLKIHDAHERWINRLKEPTPQETAELHGLLTPDERLNFSVFVEAGKKKLETYFENQDRLDKQVDREYD